MRLLYLLVLLCGMATITENQTTSEKGGDKVSSSALLQGTVKSFEIDSDSQSIANLVVKLEMKLLNNGSKPVFFLQDKPPEIRGWALAKSKEALSRSDNISFDYFGESVNTSPEWAALRKALDQPSPPIGTVRILQPNESWAWIETVTISLPRTDKNKASYSDKQSWESIKQLPELWLLPVCQVWSLNLEPKSSKDRTEMLFGHKLQKRWKNVGLLLLDVTNLEPIKLDLKTAVVR